MPRIYTPAPRYYTPTSGTLGEVLTDHVRLRFERFFWVYAYIEVIKKALQLQHGSINANDIIKEAATHQAAVGRRDRLGLTTAFDRTNANILNANATGFSSLDATHLSNIGVLEGFLNAGSALGGIYVNICEDLKAFLGDTFQLPQAINIGPDRIVDQWHFAYTSYLINNNTPITANAMIDYRYNLYNMMSNYLAHSDPNSLGMHQCINTYITFYNQPTGLDLDYNIRKNIREELQAVGFTQAQIANVVIL